MSNLNSMIKILKRKDVEAMTGLSRSTIYVKISKKAFPAPIKLSERSVGWVESEVQEWLSAKVAESRG